MMAVIIGWNYLFYVRNWSFNCWQHQIYAAHRENRLWNSLATGRRKQYKIKSGYPSSRLIYKYFPGVIWQSCDKETAPVTQEVSCCNISKPNHLSSALMHSLALPCLLFFFFVILTVYFRFFSAYDLAFTTYHRKDPFNVCPLSHATSSQ